MWRHYTRAAVTDSVDELAAAGLLQHDRTRPSPAAKRRSRFRATDVLLEKAKLIRSDAFRCCRGPSVIVRDRIGQPIVRDCRTMWRLAAEVDAHNKFIGGFVITIDHPDARLDDHGFVCVGSQRVNPHLRYYCRIYNGSWLCGGRWFGPWWQQLPSRTRTGLRIDGAPCVEEDFPACHLRLLMAAVGDKDRNASDDPYAMPDVKRPVAKIAVNIMLNSSSEAKALAAVRRIISADFSHIHLPPPDYIFTAARLALPHLAPFWFTGVGRRLQTYDADICARVQRRLRKLGVCCLTVHDNFLVPVQAETLLKDTMKQEFSIGCRRIVSDRYFTSKIGALKR